MHQPTPRSFASSPLNHDGMTNAPTWASTHTSYRQKERDEEERFLGPPNRNSAQSGTESPYIFMFKAVLNRYNMQAQGQRKAPPTTHKVYKYSNVSQATEGILHSSISGDFLREPLITVNV